MSALEILTHGDTLVVTSESVADGAGVEHRAVLQLIDNNINDFEDFGHVAFEMRHGYNNHKVRIALLNEQQATLLMTYQRNNEKVRAFKKSLVRAFFDMARRLTPALPQSYADALRELAASVEQKEALEAKITEDAPKVLFADAVATSATTVLIGDLAKILRGNGIEIGANRLFARLRDEGYLIRRQGSDWNMPTQRAMDLGLFKVKETAVTHSDGHVTVSKTPKVTGKGQAYFVNRYTAGTDVAAA
jgi:anti-repressor protein